MLSMTFASVLLLCAALAMILGRFVHKTFLAKVSVAMVLEAYSRSLGTDVQEQIETAIWVDGANRISKWRMSQWLYALRQVERKRSGGGTAAKLENVLEQNEWLDVADGRLHRG